MTPQQAFTSGRRHGRGTTPIWMIVPVILIGALFGLGAYGLWKLERRVHYSWSYKSMVQETIREMVKPEALR